MRKTLGLGYIGKYTYLRDRRVAFIEDIKFFATKGGRSYKTYPAIVTMKVDDKTIHDYYSWAGMNKTNSNLDIIQVWDNNTYKMIVRV